MLCGSAWRLGLPLWVRSPLPREKTERSGAGGEIGMRKQDLIGTDRAGEVKVT